jgi:tetratricopeptide (TPR) repeat protein
MPGLPLSLKHHLERGEEHARSGRIAEAIVEFKAAVDLAPRLWLSHTNLGSALTQAGRYSEACASFRRAVELNPEAAPAHYNLAIALEKVGAEDEADSHMARAAFLGYVDAQEALRNVNRSWCVECGACVAPLKVRRADVIYAADVPVRCNACGVFCATCLRRTRTTPGSAFATCPKCHKPVSIYMGSET